MSARVFSILALAAVPVSAQCEYCVSTVPNAFFDISGTGTSLGLAGEDDAGSLAPVGFDFDFYCTTTTQFGVSTNGYLSVGGGLGDFTPDCPAASAIDPNALVAPFHFDLDLGSHGEVYYETLGPLGNQVFVVQWHDVHLYGASAPSLTFQAQLREADDSIEFHYGNLSSVVPGLPILGEDAFVGLEDHDGSHAVTVACASGVPVFASNGAGVRFERCGTYVDPPDCAFIGNTFVVEGRADPGSIWLLFWSLSPGPTPMPPPWPSPLGLGIPYFLAASGFTPPSGMVATPPFVTPPSLGTKVYWQLARIGSFPPIALVEYSNVGCTIIKQRHCSDPSTGSIDTPGVADHYEFFGSIGDEVTIRMCRTDNTMMGTGTLDPLVCLLSPSGAVEASDDDSGPAACEVPGPYDSSLIYRHVLAETGPYTIVAGAYQGLGDETGTYKLTLEVAFPTTMNLVADESALCPGHLVHPGAKLLGQLPVKQ